MSRTKILLVDGEPEFRQACAEDLASAGYQVVSAATGPEGLKLLLAEKPELVVLDLRLRREEGLETFRRILARKDRPPVILTSRCAFWDEDFVTWMAEGCCLKSDGLAELRKTVRRVLRRRRRDGAGRTPRLSGACL